MIRTIEPEDLARLKLIHAKFFEHEFSFDDFSASWITNFVITDDKDDIVSAAIIRPIMEIVAITDYDKSPRVRRAALYDMLQIAQYVLRRNNVPQLHAFIQDKKWENQLLRSGFKRCVGVPLYTNVGD